MQKYFPDGLGRKFFITVYILVLLTIALFTGFIDSGILMEGLIIALGFFGATNHMEKRLGENK